MQKTIYFLLIAVSLFAVAITAVPQTLSLYSGSHDFVNGTNVDCAKCHSDVHTEMLASNSMVTNAHQSAALNINYTTYLAIGGVDYKDYYFLSSEEKLNTNNFIKKFMKHRKKSSEERELLKLEPLPPPEIPIKSSEITDSDSDSDSDSEKNLYYLTPSTNPPSTTPPSSSYTTPKGSNMSKHKDRRRQKQRRLRKQGILNKDVIEHNNSEQKK